MVCYHQERKNNWNTLHTLSKTQSIRLIVDDALLKMEDQQTYLWVTFDKRMTWRQHVTSAKSKAKRKLNIMRKLAGTKLDANDKILKSVYQGNVRPHLEYGSSSWMTAAKSHHQTLHKVQNQALQIITGAMKSTPIKSMEEITNIPPLKTRALQRKNQEVLTKYVKPIAFTITKNPCEDKFGNIIIQTSVPLITTKDGQTRTLKKTLTMNMLEDEYTSNSWVRVYTDGSAKPQMPQQKEGLVYTSSIPTKINNQRQYQHAYIVQTTKLKKKLLFMLHTQSKTKLINTTQVVFLTDAFSVLQALTNDRLPQLKQALYTITSLTTVLQWIPSHCGVRG
ncbi:unnamed protein product [Mytilus coruscus]|uniref:RNase H type-1 domain-containing protein n=1 Tax=Mytilus coruscus TaxID=42192 RepID=A0A6J8C1S2_MYTCO|nr:unnamed protein product [Mytilus coruscus]